MTKIKFHSLIINLILVNCTLTTVFAVKLNNHKKKLLDFEKKINNMTLYPVASSQPPTLLKITYIKTNGKQFYILAYDNAIDVGNEIINLTLTEFFLQYWKHNLLCPFDAIPVKITEEKNKASVIINLPEKTFTFNISLKQSCPFGH